MSSKPKHRPDKWLVLAVLLLSGIGLLSVYEASVAIALRDFSDQFYFLKEQSKWYMLGLTAMISITIVDYRRISIVSLPILLVAYLFLIAVFIPPIGIETYGARRWVNFGLVNFQPAEFMKLSLIIYLAALYSRPEKKSALAKILSVGLAVVFIIVEPDIGTASILLFTALFMYFYSGVRLRSFMVIMTGVILSLATVVLLAPYRIKRILTFLDPQHDPLGVSYQIRQILLALGSGGIFGVGIGRSRQKYAYLPEASTDSIFAIIGEEVGFIGSVLVIGLIVFILWRGFRIALQSQNLFGRYLALGIITWIGLQAAINLASIVALMPLTGIPLPFISYGGSSLIVLFCSIGILLSISRYR